MRIVYIVLEVAVSCALNKTEVEASEVLGLVAGCLGDLNGVLTSLKGNLNAIHVRTDQLFVVTGCKCFGVICPTVGGFEGVFTLLAFVYEELSATGLGILQSDVYCHLIYAGLFYGYGVKQGLFVALGDVVVLVRKGIGIRTGTSIYFVICGVLSGLVFPTGNEYYALSCKLFRKSCGELVYFVLAIAVYVEDGSNFFRGEGVVAVYALAVYNLVLVIRIYITTIGANAPSVVLSLRIVYVVVQVAVNVRSHGNLFLRIRSDFVCIAAPKP